MSGGRPTTAANRSANCDRESPASPASVATVHGRSGWLAALREPQLARAVALIHRQPERPWTVATLAAEAGMSRSHFAERFAAVLGRPPLAYLAEWRLHVARVLLRRGTLRVHEVARRVGYGSEAAFSTAFRRAAGVAPGAYRRAAVAG